MFRSIAEFEQYWIKERDVTMALMAALTDESLATEVAPGHRTLGRLAWHLAKTVPEIMNETGLTLKSVDPKAEAPMSADAILEAYAKVSEELLARLDSEWTDDDLLVEDNMFGEMWQRGFSLYALILHQVHHRGQMTVLMRQAGLVVPDVYGPAKEGWEKFGMKPPEL